MRQKILYRTVCFLFGLSIGVVYFASPYASYQQTAGADGLPPQDQMQTQTDPKTSTTAEGVEYPVLKKDSDQASLDDKQAELAQMEAEIMQELGGGVKNQQEESDLDHNKQVALLQKTQKKLVKEEVKVKENIDTHNDIGQIAKEIEEKEKKKELAAKKNNNQDKDRAQLKADISSTVRRRVVFFDPNTASGHEGILEFDVAKALEDQNKWVAFQFPDRRLATAKKIENQKPSESQAELEINNPASEGESETVEVAVAPKENQNTKATILADATKKENPILGLKEENTDLKEQVLSLKLMLQAIEADASLASAEDEPKQKNDLAEKNKIKQPKVIAKRVATKKIETPVRPSEVVQKQPKQPEARDLVKTKSTSNMDTGIEPGDTVIVIYERTPLRLGPGSQYTRVAYLPKGSQLQVDYARDGWVRVYTPDGVRAWISVNALEWF